MWGFSVFQWSTATQSSLVPRSRSACRHQIAGEGLQVGQLLRVLWGHDEAEMMAIILATIGECPVIGVVVFGVEHPARGTVLRYAVAAQIFQMGSSGAPLASRAGRHAP